MGKARARFLYIDDDPLSHKLFDCFVEARYGSNAIVKYCSNIQTAKQLLHNGKFDIVFLDNRLGSTPNGRENFRILKPHLRNASLVLISASIDASCYFDEGKDFNMEVIDKFDLREFVVGSNFDVAA